MENFIGNVPLITVNYLGYNWGKSNSLSAKMKNALDAINMGTKRFWQNHQRGQVRGYKKCCLAG